MSTSFEELNQEWLQEDIERKNKAKPKYKIIADYPGNLHPVGYEFEANQNGWPDSEKHFNKYPHLFELITQY